MSTINNLPTEIKKIVVNFSQEPSLSLVNKEMNELNKNIYKFPDTTEKYFQNSAIHIYQDKEKVRTPYEYAQYLDTMLNLIKPLGKGAKILAGINQEKDVVIRVEKKLKALEQLIFEFDEKFTTDITPHLPFPIELLNMMEKMKVGNLSPYEKTPEALTINPTMTKHMRITFAVYLTYVQHNLNITKKSNFELAHFVLDIGRSITDICLYKLLPKN